MTSLAREDRSSAKWPLEQCRPISLFQSHRGGLSGETAAGYGPHCAHRLGECFKRALDMMTRFVRRSALTDRPVWRAHRGRSDAFSCLLTEVKLLFTTRLRKLKVRLGIFSPSRTYTIVLGVCQCSGSRRSSNAIDFQEVIASGEGQGTDVNQTGQEKKPKNRSTHTGVITHNPYGIPFIHSTYLTLPLETILN